MNDRPLLRERPISLLPRGGRCAPAAIWSRVSFPAVTGPHRTRRLDNLAHTLVGAALAEAGLKRRTPLGFATLVIAANLPDIDVVSFLWDGSLEFRRGWTHGLLAIVVLPLLLTGAILLYDQTVHRRRAHLEPVIPTQIFLLAFVGVLSHPLLDWLNTYGMRWLMPFSERWFYGDALFIADPWIWLVLGSGVVVARRRESVDKARRAIAVAAVYVVVMLASSGPARGMIERAMLSRGLPVQEVMVGPVPANPNVREVVMRRGNVYLRGRLQWLPRPRLTIDERLVPINALHPAAQLAAARPEARQFLRWARFPFYRVEPIESGFAVRIDDLRYSDGENASWAAVNVLISDRTRGERTEVAEGASETDPAGTT